ncbi:MAG: glycosyltransferase family 4 protein [Planctomycetia bacterium]|nr:glycosyltransferase family 4 protein [Planctomycetia bacterium]
MNLITLGKELHHACLRYRIEPVRAALRMEGHWFSVQTMPKTPWGRWSLYHELKRVSTVIVQRRLLSPWEVPLLRRASKQLIFDFDDAFFQRNSLHHQPESPRRQARFKAMVQAADQVFAGNAWLAEYASQFTSHSKIKIMPTCVDVSRYPLAQHERNGLGIRLAWIGSSSTLKVFAQQRSLWAAIQQAFPSLEFHLICDRFPKWPEVKIIPHSWSMETEASLLASCDIGIAWMPDDSWNRGKCGLKVLQYQAAGLPVITTPVGVHRSMVEPEQHGYWATTAEEWIAAIEKLTHQPRLRQLMGQRGRQQVEQQYSTTQLINRWKVALQLEKPETLQNNSTNRNAA